MSTRFGRLPRRSIQLTPIASVVGLLLVCVASFALGMWARDLRPAIGGLAVDPVALDFGETWETGNFPWTLPIENRTSSEIEIEGFVPSCACMNIEPPTLTLQPHRATPVRLQLNLTNNRKAQVEGSVVPFEVSIRPRIRGRQLDNDSKWLLRGKVRVALTFDPPYVQFGDRLVRGQPFETRSVRLKAHTMIAGLDATCDPKLAQVQVRRVNSADDEFELNVTPCPTLGTGAFSFDVLVQPITRDRTLLPLKKSLTVAGWISEPLRAVPGELVLGERKLGESATTTIRFQALLSGRRFEVAAVDSSSRDTIVQIAEPNSGCIEARVTQPISNPGLQSASLNFAIRSEDAGTFNILVPVSYYGVSASTKTSSHLR
jgi:hypothetical protein